MSAGTSHAATSPPAPSTAAPSPGSGGAGPPRPDDAVPPIIARLAHSLPRRAGEHDKTEGFLLADEQALHDPAFAAEPDGRLRSRQVRTGRAPAAGVGLKLPTARATVMDHVEAQAAAVLRRPGAPTRAQLVLNQAPCDGQNLSLVCEKILKDIIPTGTQLTVYVTDGDRTWHHGTYTGTGRRILR